MSISVGCVGCGNMGGAILAGLARHKAYDLCGCNRSREKLRPLEAQGVRALPDARAVAAAADVIVLAVKPYQAAAVLEELRPALTPHKVLVSVAAGVNMAKLTAAVEGRCPVVRCMPNTPALVGKGVFAFCFEDPALSPDVRDLLLQVFGGLGLCVTLPEARFTAFSALIGAGPAYVFGMMQGLVQAGVTLGLQHAEARQMVVALFSGSALMAEKSPKHLIRLRDEVCSPAGLTIAGVNVLDQAGLAGLLVEAVLAADQRGREMEKE